MSMRSHFGYSCLSCKSRIAAGHVEWMLLLEVARTAAVGRVVVEDFWEGLVPSERATFVRLMCSAIRIDDGSIEVKLRLSSLEISEYFSTTASPPGAAGRINIASEAVAETELPRKKERLLNEAEAAKFLGVSKSALFRWRTSGKIGHFRVGPRILYSKRLHLSPIVDSGADEVGSGW